jgi:hypothetical protein
MSRALLPENVQDRLRDYVPNHYLMLISVIKGVVMATAAYVLLPVLNDRATLIPRLSFWLASAAGAVVSYVTWARGVVLTNEKNNLWDAVVPMLMGLTEVLLFLILTPNGTRFWWNWYLVLSAHAFCGFLITSNRLGQTDVGSDFHPDLHELGKEYERWVRSDQRGALAMSVLFAALWAGMRWVVLPRWQWTVTAQAIIGIAAFAMLCKVAWAAANQRRRIDEFVTRHPPHSEPIRPAA